MAAVCTQREFRPLSTMVPRRTLVDMVAVSRCVQDVLRYLLILCRCSDMPVSACVSTKTVQSCLDTSVSPCKPPTSRIYRNLLFLLQALALAAPAEALAAFRPWVDQALSRPQDVDRPATLAAMEAVSGLLAAGAPFAGAAPGAAWPDPQLAWCWQ
jgi:hypothetical protein